MTIKGTVDSNFWESNPDSKYFDECVELIDQFGLKRSSQLMWAVYLSEHPDSDFFSFTIKDKRDTIAKNFLKDKDFDWSILESTIKKFPDWLMTSAEKNFKRFSDMLDQLVSEAEELDIKNKDQGSLKLQIMKSVDPLIKSYRTIKEVFDKEKESKRNVRGEDQPGFFAGKSM